MDMMNSALQYLREVRSTAAAGDGGEAYNQFLEALIQYGKRNIDSSIVISTAQTLFRENPNLIAGFRHFAPRQPPPAAAITCAEFLNRTELRSCVDVVNRVGHRFNGGATYRKFLDFIHSYKIGETTAAAVSGEIEALFEDHADLYREFARFLPELTEEEAEKGKIDAPEKLGLEKLKAAEAEMGKIGEPEKLGLEKSKAAEAEKGKRKIEETADQPAAKRRRRRSSSAPEKLGLGKLKAGKGKIEETAAEQSRRLASVAPAPPPEKLGLEKLKAAGEQPAAKRSLRRRGSPEKLGLDKLKAAARENEMEDELCRIDVMIGRLGSARESALELCRRIFARDVFPAGFRAHFTAVELVCLGSLGDLGKKVLEGCDVVGMCEVLKGLRGKKVGYEMERVRVVENWNRIRKS